MVPHVWNPNIQENEAGGLQLGGQPDLETLSLKSKGKESNGYEKLRWDRFLLCSICLLFS